MAALKQGKRKGQWKAYYYDNVTKKQAWVPAAIVNEWEGLNREQAEARLADWAQANGVKALRARRRAVRSDDELTALVNLYLEEHAAVRGSGRANLVALRNHLEGYAVKFFVQERATKDVRKWWTHTADFTLWLRTTYPSLTVPVAKRICQTVRRFGEFLARRGILGQPWLILLPRARQRPATPLTKAMTPDDVLKAAATLRKRKQPQWAAFVLLGYFASLRPEEIFALEKADFLTGDQARKDARTHSRFTAMKLGSGLSVSIVKTLTREGPHDLAKTHYSYGVVNVWWPAAAKELAALLKEAEDGRLFKGTRYQIDDEYIEVVRRALLPVKEYDFRRASGLYLGRTLGVEPFLLQDHLRHASMTTTMLYTRRPLVERETVDTQDFDDVG